MKKIITILFVFVLCSFQVQQAPQLKFTSSIIEHKLSLKEFKSLQSLDVNQNQARFLSCSVLVKPASNKDVYEFTLTAVNPTQQAEYKSMLSKLSVGDKVYFDEVKILLPTGAAVTAEPFMFTVK